MEERIKCKQCLRVFDLGNRYPIPTEQGLLCKECAEGQGFPLNQIEEAFLNDLNNELLTVTCSHSVENMPQAFALNPISLEVSCHSCTLMGSNLIFLSSQTARSYFRNELIKILNNDYPPEYISEFKRYLVSKESVNDILKFFRRKLAFDSKDYICPIHLHKVEKIDIATFQFKCDYCTQTSTMQTILTQESVNNLFSAAINACKSANTSALRTHVMRFFRNDRIDNYYYKNFFGEMHYVVEDSKSKLCMSSRCLVCGYLFGIEERLPIKLHSEEKHEICLSCYEKRTTNCCPLDNEPFPQIPEPLYPEYLFNMNFFCINDHRGNRFSYNKKNFPYHLDCEHNICEICYSDFKKSSGYYCANCLKFTASSNIRLNTNLVRKLKSLEILCLDANHKEEVARYFNCEALEAYCEKCNNPKYKQFINPSNFVKIVDAEFLKLSGKSELFNRLSRDFLKLPLSLKYNMVKGTSPDNYHQRFNQYRPFQGSKSYWFIDSPSEENFELQSNAAYELLGIFIGKPKRDSTLIVKVNGLQVYNESIQSYSNDMSTCCHIIQFPNCLPLTAQAKISITFGIGEYFHGTDPTTEIKLAEELSVKIISTTNNSGDHNKGGPFFGIILSNLFIELSFLGL